MQTGKRLYQATGRNRAGRIMSFDVEAECAQDVEEGLAKVGIKITEVILIPTVSQSRRKPMVVATEDWELLEQPTTAPSPSQSRKRRINR